MRVVAVPQVDEEQRPSTAPELVHAQMLCAPHLMPQPKGFGELLEHSRGAIARVLIVPHRSGAHVLAALAALATLAAHRAGRAHYGASEQLAEVGERRGGGDACAQPPLVIRRARELPQLRKVGGRPAHGGVCVVRNALEVLPMQPRVHERAAYAVVEGARHLRVREEAPHSMTLDDTQWQSMEIANYGNPWHSMTLDGTRWQSMTLDGNQWQSMAPAGSGTHALARFDEPLPSASSDPNAPGARRARARASTAGA